MLDVLRGAGHFNLFLSMLQQTGIAGNLTGPTSPSYVACSPDQLDTIENPLRFLSLPYWFTASAREPWLQVGSLAAPGIDGCVPLPCAPGRIGARRGAGPDRHRDQGAPVQPL